MPLLYYWRPDNYRRDLDRGASYHLNQGNPIMHAIDVGDSLWAFTRSVNGEYVLAAELIVRGKTLNPPRFQYGRYRLCGDVNRSRYFRVEGQPSIEGTIRGLSVRAKAAYLGQSFQGPSAVRQIALEDHRILCAAASGLPLEPRARILPEEQLEAALLFGESDAVQDLVAREKPGMALARQEYLYQQAPARSRRLSQELQEMYEGRCQICLWTPRLRYGENLCHGHHIEWISRGGEDSLGNMVLVCPNHHAAIHRCDAPFDYEDLVFGFSSHREELRLNLHLERAN